MILKIIKFINKFNTRSLDLKFISLVKKKEEDFIEKKNNRVILTNFYPQFSNIYMVII